MYLSRYNLSTNVLRLTALVLKNFLKERDQTEEDEFRFFTLIE
jgi:hypothetical protein